MGLTLGVRPSQCNSMSGASSLLFGPYRFGALPGCVPSRNLLLRSYWFLWRRCARFWRFHCGSHNPLLGLLRGDISAGFGSCRPSYLRKLSNFLLSSFYAPTPIPYLLVSFSSSDSVHLLDLAGKLLPLAGYLVEVTVRKFAPVFLGRTHQ